MVLELEQHLLISQAPGAKLICSKSGDIITYRDFIRLMMQDQI
jgi:hypothetical protein